MPQKLIKQLTQLAELLTVYANTDEPLPDTVNEMWLESLLKELEILKNLIK